jgi:hypothetical protein
MFMSCNINRSVANQMERRVSRGALARCAAVTGAFALVAGLQAQTNYNFNSGTNTGWANWLPDEYSGADTNVGVCLPAVTIVTNPVSAGNYAVYMESTVALAAAGGLPTAGTVPGVGTYFTNSPPLANFTMTGEFFNWTNSQSQIFGIVGRVQLPLPAVNQPGGTALTPGVSGYALAFVNRRAAEAWRYDYASGSYPTSARDELRILDTGMPGGGFPQSMGHEGAFNGLGEFFTGVSSTLDNVNGHYRLIFTASGTNLTGQIVDVSTGLPMSFLSFGTVTNMLWPDPGRWTVTNTLTGSYGFLCNLGDSPTYPWIGGSGIWATYDNFAVVPGVVSVESAATADGPYGLDTTAGIEVYPQRITVPAYGDERFYRINWIGGNHRPRITSVTPGGSVSLVTDGGLTTNVVGTLVMTYQ